MTSQHRPSKIDLSPATRTAMVNLLNTTLASAIDLSLRAKQAHWNVQGKNFLALHEFFDKLHDTADEFVDLLAERITAFGGLAEGRLSEVGAHTRLGQYRAQFAEAEHLEALAESLADFGKHVRAAIDTAANAGDAGTADLFTEISREVDKQLWFIEAQLV